MDARTDAMTLVAVLARRGVALRLEGDELVASPASRLTADDAGRVRALRDAIVAALSDQARRRPRSRCVTCGAALPPASMARCPGCVDAAYHAREERRRSEGRAPPGADFVPAQYDHQRRPGGTDHD